MKPTSDRARKKPSRNRTIPATTTRGGEIRTELPPERTAGRGAEGIEEGTSDMPQRQPAGPPGRMTDDQISLRLEAIQRRHELLESVEGELDEHYLELVDACPPGSKAESAANCSMAYSLMFLVREHVATIEREVPGRIGRLLVEEGRLLCRYHRLMAAVEISIDDELSKTAPYVATVSEKVSRRAYKLHWSACEAIAPGYYTDDASPEPPSFLKTGS